MGHRAIMRLKRGECGRGMRRGQIACLPDGFVSWVGSQSGCDSFKRLSHQAAFGILIDPITED